MPAYSIAIRPVHILFGPALYFMAPVVASHTCTAEVIWAKSYNLLYNRIT
ncbi:MAG TPA: hypothetical protein PLA68_02210 [Panacibacter sp.]|nr:hypothetical protein [Panacibacter sp.]